MKKAVFILFLVSVCFMLSGCIIIGGNPGQSDLALGAYSGETLQVSGENQVVVSVIE